MTEIKINGIEDRLKEEFTTYIKQNTAYGTISAALRHLMREELRLRTLDRSSEWSKFVEGWKVKKAK